jgi:CubicO group peptidase (beta-lactamase class C family)
MARMDLGISCRIGMGALIMVALLAAASRTHAQPGNQPVGEAIDAFAERRIHELNVPGAAIAVVRDDRIEHLKGYGIADSSGRTVTPQTPFHIASLSKAFTAAAIARLVETGQVALDAPVKQYLPWFRVADAQASDAITIRHLLHHTSGLSTYDGDIRNLDTAQSEQALEASIRALSGARLNHAPGEQYEYSNTNYDILGLVVQVVSGRTFDTFIEQELFTPLEMRRSYTSLHAARANGATSGYYITAGMPVVADAIVPVSRATGPSAGFASTAEDLSHWLVMHLNGGQFQGSQVLSPSSLALLHTPGITVGEQSAYAMGWITYPFSDAIPASDATSPAPRVLAHGGEWLGATALIAFMPEQRTGVVMLLNASNPPVSSELSLVAYDLLLIALGVTPKNYPANSEDFLGRNQRAVALSLLLASLLANVVAIRRRVSQRGLLIIALAHAVVVVGGLFWLLPERGTRLDLMLRFTPDVGALSVAVILTAAWSLVKAATAAIQARVVT